jgi:uncharacterized membrane protein YcjF (UPF0283 family)
VVSSDPELTEFEEVVAHHRPGRRGRIIRRARTWLVAMFVGFRIISTAIWTTALLICIWQRQIWARYVLTTLLLIGVLALAVTLPGFVSLLPRDVIARVSIIGVIDGLIAWGLIAVPSLRRYFSTNLT